MRLPLILLLLAGSSAGAVDSGWLRSGGVYNYTDSLNWAGGQVNDIFSAALTVDHSLLLRFSDNYTAQQGLTFEGTIDNVTDSGSSYVVDVNLAPMSAGKIFTLGGDIRLQPKRVPGGSMPQFFFRDIYGFRIDLGGSDRTFHVDDAILWTNGGVQGQGGIVKTGTGTLRLLGDNTFTGDVDLQQGTLEFDSPVGLSSGLLKLAHGTKMRFEGANHSTIANEVLINGDVRIGGYGAPNFAGQIHLGSATRTVTISDSSGYPVEFSGMITGGSNVGLAIAGDNGGPLILSGTGVYGGGTTVLSGGALIIGNKNALGAGSLTLGNGAKVAALSNADLTGANAVANPIRLEGERVIIGSGFGASAKLEFSSPIYVENTNQTIVLAEQNITLSGDISGIPGASLVVDKMGYSQSGTLILKGANSLEGGITIRAALSVSDPRALGAGPLVFEGGILEFTNSAPITSVIRNQVRLRGPMLVSSWMPTEFAGEVEVGPTGEAIQIGFSDVTLSGPLTGSGSSVTLMTNGFLRMNTAATYSGETNLSGGGRLVLGHHLSLGTGTINISGPVSIQGSTTLKGPTALANNVVVKSEFSVGGAVDVEFAGGIDLGNAQRKLTLENTALTTISGEIRSSSTTAGLTKAGSMSLLLTGQNTYSGPTRIEAGRLLVGSDAPKGAAGALGNAISAVTLYGGASLIIDGSYEIGRNINSESGSGRSIIGNKGISISRFSGNIVLNNSLEVVSADGGMVELDGVISGTRSMYVTGSGTVVFGNANTYTGTTNVSAGTLRVANVSGSATGSGSVFVTKGTLTGSGSISGAVSVGNGFGIEDAILAPGDGVGTLSTGGITLSSDAVFRFEFDSVKSVADLIRSAGPVSLVNPKLVLLHLSSEMLPLGAEFLLIENADTSATTGKFAGLPQDADIQFGANLFRIDYHAIRGADGIGNDIVLRVVPEPTTGISLLSGLFLGRTLFRRRKS